ncbi:hypothetical protein, partial [Planktomarina sp.]|uniref:hypothetical protein n=1 Tax=Planktomarina sp. TaxID=2024851 RepID=UPI003261350F
AVLSGVTVTVASVVEPEPVDVVLEPPQAASDSAISDTPPALAAFLAFLDSQAFTSLLVAFNSAALESKDACCWMVIVSFSRHKCSLTFLNTRHESIQYIKLCLKNTKQSVNNSQYNLIKCITI